MAYNAFMSQEDYDVDRLAEYLHMMPAAILKLRTAMALPTRVAVTLEADPGVPA